MKKMKKIYWMLFIILCAACNDPYDGDTYVVFDMQPAGTYLSNRSDDFSEWIHIMKYADLYNAVNQATQSFTLFVPNNAAVKEFYNRKGVSSIEDLGTEYARSLVSYHIVQDTISQEIFIEKEGALAKRTVSDDVLMVSFGSAEVGGGGMQSVYLNNEAHVIEFANKVSNGYVYVLENTLTPLTESVYARISESGRPYTILKSAMDATGVGAELDVIYDDIVDDLGQTTQQKRNYTLLAVSDDVFKEAGVNSLQDLVQLLGAGSDYTNPENALYQYVAYHVLDGSYDLSKLRSFDTPDATSKIWNTLNAGSVIRISKEDKIFYLNYRDENRACFVEDYCNLQAKNGYIHQVSSYLPVAEAEPETVLFDVCNYSIIGDWIAAGNGEDGIKFQESFGTAEKKCDVSGLNCYEYSLNNPSGTYGSYYNVTYFTTRTNNGWNTANNMDFLMLNLGNTGWVSMQTPSIIKGKYKVTLRFGYATSMEFIRTSTGGSNGGKMIFSFDGENSVTCAPYTTVPSKTLGCYSYVLYPELEFTETSTHTFRLVMNDPAASKDPNYRILIDYLLFEPILIE